MRGDNVHGTRDFSNCIVFENNQGNIYASGASHTLDESFTVPAGKTLTVEGEHSLTIPEGKALTVDGYVSNNGTITNNGTLILRSGDKITGEGTLEGNGSYELAVLPEMITVPTDLVYNGKDQRAAAASTIGLSENTSKPIICSKEFVYNTSV